MSGTTLFLGRLGTRVETAELEDIFNKFGKVSRLDIKRGQQYNFGFVEYEEKRDAEDAQKDVDGKELSDGSRVVVEFAKGTSRPRGDRDSTGCFKCGKEGHFARDCREGGDDRGGRGGGDRYGGGGRGGYRDRSPPRRRYSRSPPRRRYDDRDDRRAGRDDHRDDRDRSPPAPRRDERDRSPPRRDERSPAPRSP
ncbi:UNVERIFIED_CONTAM: hypothetical protein HDU68_003099 [Siphonaria sp. JEL0065]|nr:hypothetical protein HDU68_003099 [Siphonaria sp. JEL0065]